MTGEEGAAMVAMPQNQAGAGANVGFPSLFEENGVTVVGSLMRNTVQGGVQGGVPPGAPPQQWPSMLPVRAFSSAFFA
jgi:hypothetical protein